MRSNRRKNWLVKRIALGLAIPAFAAPVAQAKVDEGSGSPPGAQSASGFAYADHGMPSALPSAFSLSRGDQIEIVRSQPRSTGSDVVASDYQGLPRVTPLDYALYRGDLIENVRATSKANPSDKIEFVRNQPRSVGEPQVVAVGFNWKDAGIGAGFAVALLLLGWGAVQATKHIGRTQTA